MKNLFLKEASSMQDLDIIETLAVKIWHEHYEPIIGKAQVEYMLDKFQSKAEMQKQMKTGYLYFIVQDETGQNIGYIGLLPKDDELFLSKIYITAETRGRGYGRQTMDFIESLAKKKNLNRITLTVNRNNINSIKAYERFGFNTVDSAVTDIGNGFVMDDYIMGKILS